MSGIVTYELNNKVATITMDDGKVNAISHDMLDALNSAFDQAEQDRAVVILRGREGTFSGGFDLKIMMSGLENALKLVNRGSLFTRRLLAFPTPVIAVSTGHAVAKGAFILLCSDYRIGIEQGFKFGLNEVYIGMPMHNAGIEMARGRLTRRHFNRSVINGEMFDGKGAEEAGFLDLAVPADQLMIRAQQAAKIMGKMNMRAHHATKLRAREELLARMDEAIEKDLNITL